MARRRRARVRRDVAIVVLGAVLLCGGLLLRWALPPVRLPAATGAYAVGTTVVEWTDRARGEPATADGRDLRFVVAQLWYPVAADAAGPQAWYLGRDAQEADAVARGVADAYGLPAFLLDRAGRASGPGLADVPVVGGTNRYPVVLFSPGLQGVRQQNTAWAVELASHGYVVAALDHPYDSAVVVRADGRSVRTAVRATGDDDEDERRADGWTATRAADLRFALDQLESVDRGRLGAGGARLTGRIDLRRVAVAGHSLGGAAALQAAVLDDRFRAVINIDGLPRLARPGPHRPPTLTLVAGRGTGSSEGDRRYAAAVDHVLARSASPSFRLVVPGAGHLSFTDAALYLPPLPSLFGTRGRTATIEGSRQASLAFLDGTLRGGSTSTVRQQLADLGEVAER